MQLVDAATAAHQKLAEYYSHTDGPRDFLYNLACVLGPQQKLERYRSDAIEPKYVKIYKDEVQAFYKAEYIYLDHIEAKEPEAHGGFLMDLASILVMEGFSNGKATRQLTPLDKYLQSPVVKGVDERVRHGFGRVANSTGLYRRHATLDFLVFLFTVRY